jgi:hypothetical protein
MGSRGEKNKELKQLEAGKVFWRLAAVMIGSDSEGLLVNGRV